MLGSARRTSRAVNNKTEEKKKTRLLDFWRHAFLAGKITARQKCF